MKGVIKSLCEVPYFINILDKLIPNAPIEAVIAKLKSLNTVSEFQHEFIIPYLRGLEKNTTDGISASGLEGLDPKGGYIFMSNHRDIILDSAFMNVLLDKAGLNTTEIAIGSNLLIYEWIVDLVKLNKSFVVKRDLPVRQMMEASSTLSAYIRDRITEGKQNIWIAQREGRSKDGNDKTQGAVLKMLNLSGTGDLVSNFRELNIVPVAITYEYDPCDALKGFQYQQKRDDANYKKSKNEDLTHMATGLNGRKGRVHFAFGTPINNELASIESLPKNDQIARIAEMIDRQIYTNYRLYPANYIAIDTLEGSSAHASHYTQAEKDEFLVYADSKIAQIEGADHDYVLNQMLTAYANPLKNQEATVAGK
ncbi:MAG: 1-acyl-sn-glycerol-3-phosphate acyltransferase [Marinilabiliaceae bacterium]